MRTYIDNKNERTKGIDLLKVVTLASLTGALAVAPLLTVSAEAAPGDQVPAYGYRNRDKDKKNKKNKPVIRDRNRDGYDDRDQDRDGDLDEDDGYDYRETPRYQRTYGDRDNVNNDGRWNNGQRQTVRGTVVRRLANNRFELRSGGSLYTVNSRYNLSNLLKEGDRVEVTGNFTANNVLRADAVRILNTNNNNNGGWNSNIGTAVNFPATVLSTQGNNNLTVRGDNGRTYVIRTNNNISSNINRGDRVRIVGRVNNNTVMATQVQLLSNNNGNLNNGSRVEFSGVVNNISGWGNTQTLMVRADNGRTYTVRPSSGISSDINRGDRVRVIGQLSNNTVTSAQVSLLDGRNDDGTIGSRISFRGVVTNISGWGSTRILTVRAENGRTYTVRTREDNWQRGDRVRIEGTLRTGNVIDASDIDSD